MIRLFRRLRLKFLRNQRLGKYMIYAFGEILLVVIGILIALQVNNWNEKRKIRIGENESIERLHQEAIETVKYLTVLVQEKDFNIAAVEKSARALKNKSLGQLSREEFAFGIYSTAYFEGISPPKNVFEELKDNGKIQHIRSDTIRNLISGFHAGLEYINNQLDYFRLQYTKPIDAAGDSYLYEYAPDSNGKISSNFDFEALCNNSLFVSKHAKALRDLVVFNNFREELLHSAIKLCEALAQESGGSCDIE